MSNKRKREEWENSFREGWMTDDQFECWKMIAEIHGGFHHTYGKVHENGNGIRFNSTCTHYLSTFDFDMLTRLVICAHDQMIRVEICPSGPNMIAFVMHKRHKRDGRMHERHPTIEEAICKFRGLK